jgi:NADH-quinone oxidoreductase subunit N
LLIFSGIRFKVASVTFHLWVPDVYEGAPLPTVAFLSVASKAAGFLLLIRLLTSVFTAYHMESRYLFGGLAGMTIVYGSFGALAQTNLKRLLGYSSIGHAGYLLIGIASGNAMGFSAVLYYLMTFAVSNLVVFITAGLAASQTRNYQLDTFRGLAVRSPFLGMCLFVSVLSLAGVPPTAGFFGKFLILLAAVKSGSGWLALLGTLAVTVSLYYYLNLIRIAYAEEPSSETPLHVSGTFKLLLSMLLGGIVILGLFPYPLLSWTERIAYSLF